MKPNALQLIVRRLSAKAGIADGKKGPHRLRHTFATNALLNGAGEFEVQSVLGHSSLAMTRRCLPTLRSENTVIGHRNWSPVDNLRLKQASFLMNTGWQHLNPQVRDVRVSS